MSDEVQLRREVIATGFQMLYPAKPQPTTPTSKESSHEERLHLTALSSEGNPSEDPDTVFDVDKYLTF